MSNPVTDPGTNPFDAGLWEPVAGFDDLTDITYHRHVADGAPKPTVRVAFNRPEVRNAFRPHTVDELYRVLDRSSTRSTRRRPLTRGCRCASCCTSRTLKCVALASASSLLTASPTEPRHARSNSVRSGVVTGNAWT